MISHVVLNPTTTSVPFRHYSYNHLINVREYRRGNQKWTIQRNWQHRVHKTGITSYNDDECVIISSLLKRILFSFWYLHLFVLRCSVYIQSSDDAIFHWNVCTKLGMSELIYMCVRVRGHIYVCSGQRSYICVFGSKVIYLCVRVIDFVSFYYLSIYIIMWSCPGNMSKYYPVLRDILPSGSGDISLRTG
jgi:hypothetical protein